SYDGPMPCPALDSASAVQAAGQPVAMFASGLRRSEPTPESAGVAERDTLSAQGLRRSEPTPENAGVAERDTLRTQGLRRSEPTPENAGVAERDTLRTQGLRRSEPTPENAGVALNKEASLLRNRSEAKRDAARFAGADAVAPEEDPLTTEVHDLVRRLPWERTKLGRLPNVMREAYEDLVPAIAAVVREGRLTLDEARN